MLFDPKEFSLWDCMRFAAWFSYATWCFVRYILRMRFLRGIFLLFVGRCEISLWDFLYFHQGFSFRLLFLRVDCECNRPSCLATVFDDASAFNGNINQWDVAKVTDTSESKSNSYSEVSSEGMDEKGRYAFWWLWDVLVRFYAFCYKQILMRCHAYLVVARFAYKISCLFGPYEIFDELSCFFCRYEKFWWAFMPFGCLIFFFMVWCKDGGEVMLKDTGNWVCSMVNWMLLGFVCASWVVCWREINVSWVVVGESASALGYIKWMRIFADDVTWPELALVIQRGSLLGGSGWWSNVCNLKNIFFFWAVTVFWSGFFRLLFLRFDCERNQPSFHATVFYFAVAFNGDLNQWDVAKVTTMSFSKSIRILENDLSWCEIMLLWLEGTVGGLVGGDYVV